MAREKRALLGTRKNLRRKKRRLARSIVAYLESDGHMFAPLISSSPLITPLMPSPSESNPESSKATDTPLAGFEKLGVNRVKKNKRMSEKLKEYLNSDYHMYGAMFSPPKLDSSLKGDLQITNIVTMEVSTSTTTTIREDNNNRNLQPDIVEQTLQGKKTNAPKAATVILDPQWNWTKP